MFVYAFKMNWIENREAFNENDDTIGLASWLVWTTFDATTKEHNVSFFFFISCFHLYLLFYVSVALLFKRKHFQSDISSKQTG